MLSNNPSVIGTLASQCPADSSPYTGEPTAAAGLLNGKSLYGTTRLAGGFREPKIPAYSFRCMPGYFYPILYSERSLFGNAADLFKGDLLKAVLVCLGIL